MKVSPWSSIVDLFTSRMFVTDKNKHLIFFPWGSKRKGFVLDNEKIKQRIANFYTGLAIAFFFVVIMLTGSKNFWLIIAVFLLSSLVYLFIWFLYIRIITANLKAFKESYAEIALAKISVDSEKEEALSIEKENVAPKNGSKPKSTSEIERMENDPFLQIKRVYYNLSAGQLFVISGFGGLIITGTWMTFYPQVSSGKAEGYFFLFLALFFWGLGFFFLLMRSETSNFFEFVLFAKWNFRCGALGCRNILLL